MINSSSEFIRLRTSNLPGEYKRAGCEEASYEVWVELIEKHPEMRVWAARNRTINTEIQKMLLKSEDPLVRHAIASKYPLDRELYQILSKDIDERVRYQIAHNKKTPLDIYRKNSRGRFRKVYQRSC